MRPILGLVLLAFAASACSATTYAFVPATNATASLYGHPAVDYAIPPQTPHGTLRVASYGIEPMSPADDSEESVATLHVRLFVSNQSDQPWTVDTREQQASLEGHATSTPAFASANPGGSSPPVVTIVAHGTRLVDLFFPLPADSQDASDLPNFTFTASVHTDAGLVSEATPFARVTTDRDSAYASDDSAPQAVYDPNVYGYDYWDAPVYYNPTFVAFYGGIYPHGYWGRPFYARGRGWGPGYYHGWHGPYRGGAVYRGGYHGAYRGGGGYHGGGGHGGGGHGGHR